MITAARRRFTASVLAALLALAVQLPSLGATLTIDEVGWMERSREHWRVMLAGDVKSTFQSTHPGVTTAWLAGAGIVVQEARLGVPLTDETLQHFRKSGVLPMALVAAVLVGIITWLATGLFGVLGGWAAGVLLAVQPFSSGLNVIVGLDGLLALLMLGGILGVLVWRQHRQWRYLVLAGVLFGGAMGSKLAAAALAAPTVLAVMIAVHGWRSRPAWLHTLRHGAFVLGVAALTFYVLWPALWVKDDIDRSLRRDLGVVLTEEHASAGEETEVIARVSFYVRTVLGRLTPIDQGLLIAGVALITLSPTVRRSAEGQNVLWLLAYAVFLTVVVTFVAKKADRYALPALVAIPLVAGWALAALAQRWHIPKQVPAAVVLAAAALPLLWAPYAIAYNNPLFPNVRPLPQQGWGEGLEQAAAWLNQQPDAADLTVASWYAPIMRTYFVGETVSLGARDTERVDYVVTYRNMAGRGSAELPTQVLAETANLTPTHTVFVHATPYVWIYQK